MDTMELKTQYLLYDENCPLCNWYTRMFVKYGFIQNQARMSYQQAIQNDELSFDRERAKSEIALVTGGGNTLYGVDSMLKVISYKWKVFSSIGHFFLFNWLLKLLYRFISFNRKVIAPTTCGTECSCTPSFNPFWRIVFISFCGLMTYLLVGNFINHELSTYLKNEHFSLELALFVGQLVFQTIVFKILKGNDLFTYLGHVAFISLLGAIALGSSEMVLNFLKFLNVQTGLLAPFLFGAIVCLMFVEHNRRVKLLGLSSWLTVSLILFRILIYPLVFNF